MAEVWDLVKGAEAGWDRARAEVDRLCAEARLANASAHSAGLAPGARLDHPHGGFPEGTWIAEQFDAVRPAPAWDEEAVVEGMARAVYPLLFADDRQPPRGQARSDAELREGERDVARERMRQALAVVRDHLPVKPSREEVYRAWHGTEDPWGGCADSASIERVLDLLHFAANPDVRRPSMPDAPTPLDLDALAAAEAEAKHYRAQRDEWFLMESGAREAAEAEVILLRTRIRKARRQRDETRAEVARLTARPAPAWDEDAVALAVFERSHEPSFEDSEEGMREAKRFVRSLLVHLPVKPGREDMVEAMLGSDIITDDLRAEASAQGSTQREPFLCFADAILDLWPGRSEAVVKAEGLREAAEELDWPYDEITRLNSWEAVTVVLGALRARADRLTAEGGADRG